MIENFPQKLKDLRMKFHYSQKTVADIIGLSPSVIGSYESGERTPSLLALIKLANLHGCSIDYLLGRQTAPTAATLNVEGLSPEQVQALTVLVESLRKHG